MIKTEKKISFYLFPLSPPSERVGWLVGWNRWAFSALSSRVDLKFSVQGFLDLSCWFDLIWLIDWLIDWLMIWIGFSDSRNRFFELFFQISSDWRSSPFFQVGGSLRMRVWCCFDDDEEELFLGGDTFVLKKKREKKERKKGSSNFCWDFNESWDP